MSGFEGVPVNASEVAVVWAPNTAIGASLVGAGVGAAAGAVLMGAVVIGAVVIGAVGNSASTAGANGARPRASTPWVVARRH